MAEYIERKAFLKHMERTNRYFDVKFDIEEFPAADVAPVRHGRWKREKHKLFGNIYDYVCSVCGCDYAIAEYKYCPNCGAKMDKDD